MDLNSRQLWSGKICVGGFVDGRGGETAVFEPATGNCIGRIGVAKVEDVGDAATQANAAQRAWANTSFETRANVFYEAARLLKERASIFNAWNVAECGSVEAKVQWEVDGLAAAVHSRSQAAAMNVVEQLRCGMVHINDQTVNNEFHVPFGGVGASGNGGRFDGPANIDAFTQSQWVSTIEKSIQYPF